MLRASRSTVGAAAAEWLHFDSCQVLFCHTPLGLVCKPAVAHKEEGEGRSSQGLEAYLQHPFHDPAICVERMLSESAPNSARVKHTI